MWDKVHILFYIRKDFFFIFRHILWEITFKYILNTYIVYVR